MNNKRTPVPSRKARGSIRRKRLARHLRHERNKELRVLHSIEDKLAAGDRFFEGAVIWSSSMVTKTLKEVWSKEVLEKHQHAIYGVFKIPTPPTPESMIIRGMGGGGESK